MKRASLALPGLALALLLAAGRPALAESPIPWLHVQVNEEGSRASRVHVNLPLSVVRAVLEVSPEMLFAHGRARFPQGGDLKVSDLRRIWRELRDSGEAELLSAEEGDEVVRVSKRQGRLQIRADKRSGKVVRVDVPVPVVDALLSGEGEELNLREAFIELEKLRGDIVRVEEKGSRVRIWIDERN